MSGLRDLQRAFRRALLAGDEAEVAGLVEDDGLAPSERIAVYRNNVAASLTAVLREAFPAVRRLVDDRFFDYAAYTFLRNSPPARPCLAEYGEAFPGFLARFEPCANLEYLPDVARLEWLVHAAAVAPEAAALGPQALGRFAPEDTPHLRFKFVPSFGLIASCWPIELIWRANLADTDDDGRIDLGSGGCMLEVVRRNGDVVLRMLTEPVFAFRRALSRGEPLETATEAGFAADPAFDLAASLAALFGEGLIAAVTGPHDRARAASPDPAPPASV